MLSSFDFVCKLFKNIFVSFSLKSGVLIYYFVSYGLRGVHDNMELEPKKFAALWLLLKRNNQVKSLYCMCEHIHQGGKHYLLSRNLDSSQSNWFWKFLMPPLCIICKIFSPVPPCDRTGFCKGHRQINFLTRTTACANYSFPLGKQKISLHKRVGKI